MMASSMLNEGKIEPCYGHVLKQPTQLAGVLNIRLSYLLDSYGELRETNFRASRHT